MLRVSVPNERSGRYRGHLGIGRRIGALRLRRGLTIAELTKRNGYAPGFISQVEKDLTNPSIPSIHSIAGSGWFSLGPAEPWPIISSQHRGGAPCKLIWTETLPVGSSGGESYRHGQ